MESLQLKFLRTSRMNDDRRPYTVYELEISTKLTHSWVIWKRYNTFLRLHTDLTKEIAQHPKEYTDVKMPNLPPKRLAASLAAEFIEKRKMELEEYMNALLSHPSLLQSNIVISFLEIPEAFRPFFSKEEVEDESVDDLEDDSDEFVLGKPSLRSSKNSTKTEEERAIANLLNILSAPSHMLRNKMSAIKSFEKYFFDKRPRLNASSITTLLEGNRRSERGLIQSCGDFKYSHIASSASLNLLCRLLDIERNRDAELFLDQVVKTDPAVLRQMQLPYHIIEEKGNRLNAFRLVDMLSTCDRENEALSANNIVNDKYAQEEYSKWVARHDSDALKNTVSQSKTSTDAIDLSTEQMKDVVQYNILQVKNILSKNEGWRILDMEPLSEGKKVEDARKMKFFESFSMYYKDGIKEESKKGEKWATDSMHQKVHDNDIFGSFKIHCIFPCPLKKVQYLLSSVKKRRFWNFKCHRGKLIEKLTDTEDICHFTYKTFSSPYKYRDICVLRSFHSMNNDNECLLLLRSIKRSNVPPRNDIVRATLYSSGCHLKTLDNGDTEMTLVLQMDKEGVLVLSPEILGESEELRDSFGNLYDMVMSDV